MQKMKGYQCCIRSENVQTNEKCFPWLSINSNLKKCKYPETMGNKPYHGQIPSHQTKPANSDPQGWSCTPNYATKQFLQKSVCFEGSNETTTGKKHVFEFSVLAKSLSLTPTTRSFALTGDNVPSSFIQYCVAHSLKRQERQGPIHCKRTVNPWRQPKIRPTVLCKNQWKIMSPPRIHPWIPRLRHAPPTI